MFDQKSVVSEILIINFNTFCLYSNITQWTKIFSQFSNIAQSEMSELEVVGFILVIVVYLCVQLFKKLFPVDDSSIREAIKTIFIALKLKTYFWVL